MNWGAIIFFSIIISLPTAGLVWWWWARRRLRSASAPGWVGWSLLAFVLLQVVGFAWVFGSRLAGWDSGPPAWLTIAAYVWQLFTLPVLVIVTLALLGIEWSARVLRWVMRRGHMPANTTPTTTTPTTPTTASTPAAQPPAPGDGPSQGWTRRQVLASAAFAGLPMALHTGATLRGATQLDSFRVRTLTVALPTLPVALEGFTIAHVSDTHVGRFTRGDKLGELVDAVNGLNADLVAVTGDMIDFAIADLPAATDMIRAFRSRHGTFVCEGNHDLFESRSAFEQGVREAGLRLLLNEAETIFHNGQGVQVMGIQWGNPPTQNVRRERGRGSMHAEHVAAVARLRDLGSFPILLAHHPHAFDDAAAAGIPLTLAGHTHGGQLNPIPQWGPGDLMYKYVSGLYTQPLTSASGPAGTAAVVVSNGTGNWFPLRINAPAEVVRVRLVRGNAS